MPGGDGDLNDEDSSTRPERVRFSQEQSMSIVLRHDMMHDYSNGNVDEDPHMMAFFDSLIQAGGDPWSSEEDSDDDFILLPLRRRASDDSDQSSLSTVSDSDPLPTRPQESPRNQTVHSLERSFHPSSSTTSSSPVMSPDSSTLQPHSSAANHSRHLESTDSDAPYRARAKKAVRRLRQMRSRVLNSDTSDSDEASDVATTSQGIASSSADSKSCDTSATHELACEETCDNGVSWSHSVCQRASNDIEGTKNSVTNESCGSCVNQVTSAVNNGKVENLNANKVSNTVNKPVNGRVHNLVNGQECFAGQNTMGDNVSESATRETTADGEVNGNQNCEASTSAGSADLNFPCTQTVSDNPEAPEKPNFKKLKNRNVSRRYRRHSSSSSQHQSSGEDG